MNPIEIRTEDLNQEASPLIAVKQLLFGDLPTLVITGAGISAESGVPTFRGAGERWRNKHFSELASPEAFAKDPREIWDWYLYRRVLVAACKPNGAHQALADWAKRRPGAALVTQNVDGLHERAGHPDVIRFHGSLWKNRCTACGAERDDDALSYDDLPHSPCCDALERPAIVWFGETISSETISSAALAVMRAKLVLVIGTSGVVWPAAGLIEMAQDHSALVIDVNPDDPCIRADISIRLPAGVAVPAILS